MLPTAAPAALPPIHPSPRKAAAPQASGGRGGGGSPGLPRPCKLRPLRIPHPPAASSCCQAGPGRPGGRWKAGRGGLAPAAPQRPAAPQTAPIALHLVPHRACTRRWVRACTGRAATAAFWVKVACILLRVAGWGGASAEETGAGAGGAHAQDRPASPSHLMQVRGSPGGRCKPVHCLRYLKDALDAAAG